MTATESDWETGLLWAPATDGKLVPGSVLVMALVQEGSLASVCKPFCCISQPPGWPHIQRRFARRVAFALGRPIRTAASIRPRHPTRPRRT